jgi:hypothetical protein
MNRTQSILISLWLFLSCPFNIVTLKILIRDICWMVFQLYAGLSNYLLLQYLFAMLFVVGVIYFFLRGYKLGRTLALVLLAGSSLVMIAALLIGFFYDPSNRPTLTAFAVTALILLVNLACLQRLSKKSA